MFLSSLLRWFNTAVSAVSAMITVVEIINNDQSINGVCENGRPL